MPPRPAGTAQAEAVRISSALHRALCYSAGLVAVAASSSTNFHDLKIWHDYVIANADGASFRADLNNALAAILSSNSGSSAPSTTAPHMLWADTSSGKLKQRNAADTAWVSVIDLGSQAVPTGTQVAFAGMVAPTGWLLEYGRAVSRTTYADLYNALCPVVGTFTVTIASPGVFTKTAHA